MKEGKKKLVLPVLVSFFLGVAVTLLAINFYSWFTDYDRQSSSWNREEYGGEPAVEDEPFLPKFLPEGRDSSGDLTEEERRRRRFLQNYRSRLNTLFDEVFDDELFSGSANPFEEMEEMHREMMDRFREQSEDGAVFGGLTGQAEVKITHREDDSYKYVEIDAGAYVRDSLRVTVKEGVITVAGEVRRTMGESAGEGGRAGVMTGKFRKVIPVPEGVDQEAVEMQPEKDKVILKFPKVG